MRRFSWFVLVKCVDYPIRMRHFSSRAIALGANFANKEIGRFTKSGSSMEEEKHKKPLLSYEEVTSLPLPTSGSNVSRKWPSKWKKNVKKGYRAVRRFLAFFGDP